MPAPPIPSGSRPPRLRAWRRAPRPPRRGPRRRVGRTSLVLLLALATVALGSACASQTDTTATGGSDSTAASLPTTTTEAPLVPATTDPPGTTRFNVYWLRDCPSADTATAVGDCRIAVGTTRTTTDTDILTAALVALGDGPDATEQMAGFTSNIRPIVDLAGVTVEDGVAVVDYNRYFETAATRPQVAQVVYTLTQFPTITSVRFLIDGAPNGATGTRPTSRADVLELTPSVLVESPAPAGVVSSSFAVAGTLQAADVTFTTEVVTVDGATLVEVAGAAVAGAPGEPPPFVQRVTIPPGTDGPVRLVVTAADGTQTQIPVVVQAG